MPKSAKTASTTSEPPFEGRTLADGEVTEVDSLDGAKLQSVEDGVVRSDETSVELLEIGTADRLAATYDLRADKGATLLVFTLETTRNDRDPTLAADADEVAATVVVDGEQRDLPNWDTGGTRKYAGAVPADRREVELRLKYGRFTQTFDLLEAEPTGDRPAALYRAKDSTVVDAGDLAPASFQVNAFDEGLETYAVTAAAELGYLTYMGAEPPSADDKAWLTVTAGEKVSGGGSCSATIDAKSLTDDKGASYEPVPSASKIAEPGIDDQRHLHRRPGDRAVPGQHGDVPVGAGTGAGEDRDHSSGGLTDRERCSISRCGRHGSKTAYDGGGQGDSLPSHTRATNQLARLT